MSDTTRATLPEQPLPDWVQPLRRPSVNEELIRRARRNPPPAEWYDSPEEECPFVEDDDEPNAPDLRG